MAIKFNELNGAAKKGAAYMKLENGTNVFRMVGGVLPRYLYWPRNGEGKTLPFECVGFDREKERFTNVEKDWVQELVMDDKGEPIKCGWAYAVQVINRKTGKLEILNLKKKMFESLLAFAKDIQKDPTDIENGFDVIVDRKSTGSQAYNVDYTINQVQMMKAGSVPLSAADRVLIAELKSIEEVIPRMTSDEQLTALNRFLDSAGPAEDEDEQSDTAKEAINDLDDIDA